MRLVYNNTQTPKGRLANKMSESYKNAGVDVHAGYEAVSRIKNHVKKTHTPNVLGEVGGFGGFFSLAGINMEEPVLVSGTDGVGTKLEIAFKMSKHTTIGIDAVAMCVNDVITSGARPLFFLDYIACGKLNPQVIEEIVEGIAKGCQMAGCALLGGETAEHPGLMPVDEYDVAGFCVAIVNKSDMILGKDIKEGDVVIGLKSSGVHSNGFALTRKIIKEKNLKLDKNYEELGGRLGDVLLIPTKIYTKQVLELCEKLPPKGMAHITGGGFGENIPRILPDGLAAVINRLAWDVPSVFNFLAKHGNLDPVEMYNIYNMGIGMVLVSAKENVEQTLSIIDDAVVIGTIEKGMGVRFV